MAAASYFAWWVAALLVPCVPAQETSTPVSTSAGLVLGKMSTVIVFGRRVQVETFWGIPYAKPPTGDLRFEKTEPVEPWTGIRNAWDPPKACMQKVNDVVTLPDQMSEDCLYLNIWRPHCNQTNMATLVWVHGGGLKSGSSADPRYNGEILAGRECVIVASMNYRLNVFGFLSTGYPFKGNVGVYDVLYALRFINTNVHVFGGNNSFITLFGGGAGAYIVSTFLMSTCARDLFRNAILQSGSPFMQMMYQSWKSARTSATELAKTMGCSNITFQAYLDCLRNATSTNLLDAYHATTKTMRHLMVSTLDNDFLTMDPTTYFKTKSIKNCSILVGTNRDEGTESLIKMLPTEFNISNPEAPVFSEQKVDMTLKRFLGMLYKIPYVPHIVTALKMIYDYDNLTRHTTNPSLHFLSNIFGDLAYRCPQRKLIDTYTELGSQVYVYSFNRVPNITDLPAWVGATHGSEIQYVFRPIHTNESEYLLDPDRSLSILMMKMWAYFAKTGDPNVHDLGREWLPYMPGNNIMLFSDNARRKASYDRRRHCHYWNSIPDQMKD